MEKVVALRPGLRVLYMSGYTDDVIARQGILEPGLRLLPKPFSVELLLSAVSAALREEPRPADAGRPG